jgi:two-component system phosphate regulon sensor histidine kinase PhoR
MLFASDKNSKPQIFLYLLVAYIFASFAWWSFLMFDKNELLFNAQINYARLQYIQLNQLPLNDDSFLASSDYVHIKSKYERQKWMIMGEGTVFMFLLAFGSILLLKTFKKEVLLARQQSNFLLSVTHEFRTPLASIKLSLQTLARRITMEDKFQKLVNNSLEDVDRLQALVDNMLFAARMENHSYAFEKSSHNISDLITHYIDKMKQFSGGKRIVVERLDPDLEYDVDRETFYSAIVNLIENALKYSPADKPVQVSLIKYNHQIIFEVKDSGAGIPMEEKHKIFDKFYRVGNEETRNTKGTGLGLFIVKKVIEAHGGTVVVEPNMPQGSIFSIILPDTNH